MKADLYQNVCRFIFDKTGIVFGDDKTYLIESRLTPVARKHGYADVDGLAQSLGEGKAAVLTDVVDALTTNETFFFRDGKPFEEFRQHVLPQLIERRAQRKQLRIWSAACSSGQEAYSLAMILQEEAAKLQGWRTEIVGTDISRAVVARAQAGSFSQFEVQRGLPIQMLVKYFRQNGDRWDVVPQVRSMVQFREGNLMSDQSVMGTFDVVFCRNVLIYFDLPSKAAILARIAKAMSPDGYLFLGGAGTVLGVTDRFEPVPGRRAVYRPLAVPPPKTVPAAPNVAAGRPAIATTARGV